MSQSDLSVRLARWSLKLQRYDFEIKHRRGTLNVVPDTLSRIHMDELTGTLEKAEVNLNSDSFKSAEYLRLIHLIEKNAEKLPDLKVKDGRIYKRTKFRRGTLCEESVWRLWIPSELRIPLIQNIHESSITFHAGIHTIINHLSLKYYWPKMFLDVHKVVSECIVCKENKSSTQITRPPMQARFVSERPFHRLYTDLLGPYPRTRQGNAMILIILDHFSKYVFLKPLRQASAKLITKYFTEEIFPMFGVPEFIHSDNGKQYVSQEFSQMITDYGIQHIKTAFYSPQANAAERVNRVVLECVRSFTQSHQTSWDVCLSQILAALRNRVHHSTGFSPYNIVFGFPMVQHGSAYKILQDLDAVADGETIDICTST